MILLVPITTYTAGIESGENVALVPLNLATIKDIVEDKEDGFGIINHADGREQKLNVPFTDILNTVARVEGLSILNMPKLSELSNNVKVYLESIPIKAI